MKKFIVELPLNFEVEIADEDNTDEKQRAAVVEATRRFLSSLSAKRIQNTDDFWYRPAK